MRCSDTVAQTVPRLTASWLNLLSMLIAGSRKLSDVCDRTLESEIVELVMQFAGSTRTEATRRSKRTTQKAPGLHA